MGMNSSLYMPIMDERVTIIEAAFSPHKPSYRYKCDIRVKVDDIVVVEANEWYGVCRVTAVDLPIPMDVADNVKFRWVVCKINEAEHMDRLKHEDEVIDRVNSMRARAMRDQLLGALGLTKEQATRLIDNGVIEADEKEHKG